MRMLRIKQIFKIFGGDYSGIRNNRQLLKCDTLETDMVCQIERIMMASVVPFQRKINYITVRVVECDYLGHDSVNYIDPDELLMVLVK